MTAHVKCEPYVRCSKFLDCPENCETMIIQVFLQKQKEKKLNCLELALKPTAWTSLFCILISWGLDKERVYCPWLSWHKFGSLQTKYFHRLLCWECEQKGVKVIKYWISIHVTRWYWLLYDLEKMCKKKSCKYFLN